MSRKRKVLRDKHGDFRWEYYFVGGKRKRYKVRLIDGMDADEFEASCADPVTLLQMGRYDLLEQRSSEDTARRRPINWDEEDDDIPF